jgi:hypothetical protein
MKPKKHTQTFVGEMAGRLLSLFGPFRPRYNVYVRQCMYICRGNGTQHYA